MIGKNIRALNTFSLSMDSTQNFGKLMVFKDLLQLFLKLICNMFHCYNFFFQVSEWEKRLLLRSALLTEEQSGRGMYCRMLSILSLSSRGKGNTIPRPVYLQEKQLLKVYINKRTVWKLSKWQSSWNFSNEISVFRLQSLFIYILNS